ncbi:MAG: hypothetical protein J1E95_08610 [Muribaculaceae bacterium]|nr:hypothetical protein [Muribaculaceae bacterium]
MKNSIWNAVGALLLLILSVIIFLLLTGCGKIIEGDRKSQRDMENQAITNSLRTVNYNGHSYIIYREIYGSKNFGGIAHDPECDCLENRISGHDVIKYFCNCEESDLIQ